jgi:hypothetical protein
VGDPRFDPFDEVRLVEHPFELRLGRRFEGYNRLLALTEDRRSNARVVDGRRLDKTMRRQPDLQQPLFVRRRCMQSDSRRLAAHRPAGAGGRRAAVRLVPHRAAGQQLYQPLFADERLQGAATRRLLALYACSFDADRRLREIDRHRERRHREPRPRRTRVIGLADDIVGSAARDLDGGEGRGTKRLERECQITRSLILRVTHR